MPATLASFATEGTQTGDDGIFGGGYGVVTRKITLLSGQNCVRGTVLGKITASGKYVKSLSASSDGSEVPATILAEDTDASAADVVTIAHFSGMFDENALTLGTAHTVASIREALRDVGINLQSSIVR